MSVWEGIAIAAAGLGAGTINAIVGSGTLLTFPVLLAFGYSPVVANVSNNVGLVAGGLTGTFGYRHELVGQERRAASLVGVSVAGALLGAGLLLTLPASTFEAVVPVLIAAALVLVVMQPWLGARLEERRKRSGRHAANWTPVAVFAVGVYGGYFGGAQGIMLLAILGIGLTETLQRVNALKNALGTANNLTAATVFVFAAPVSWGVAALLAAGSAVGGHFGARLARVLPPTALRVVIVMVGIAAIVKLTT
jgi:uncharacterized membrane protein YfcA